MPIHPQLTHQRYPKAGDPNSTPSVHVADVETGRVTPLHAEPSDSAYLGPKLAATLMDQLAKIA